MDYLLSMAIALILQAIKESIKNPARKAALKKALLKVRDQINLLYLGEEEPPVTLP